MVTMAGMYIERGMYNMKKSIRDFFREMLELLFQAAALVIDTVRTFFLVVLAILGPIAFAISVWDGFQSHAHAVDMPLHTGLSVATRVGHVQHHTGEDTGADAAKRHRGMQATRTSPGFERRCVHRFPHHRHHRLLHHSRPWQAGLSKPEAWASYGRNVNQTAGRAGSMAGSVAGAAAGNVPDVLGKLLK
jgi:hypothetical protein